MTAPGTKLVAEILQTPGGTLVIRPKQGLALTLAAITRTQADGSFVLEPLGTWISPLEAARIMSISESSALRLRDLVKPDGSPIIISRRPTPFRIQFLLSSVLDHLETSKDSEFWPNCKPVEPAVQS